MGEIGQKVSSRHTLFQHTWAVFYPSRRGGEKKRVILSFSLSVAFFPFHRAITLFFRFPFWQFMVGTKMSIVVVGVVIFYNSFVVIVVVSFFSSRTAWIAA
jgi:hypothetical protein